MKPRTGVAYVNDQPVAEIAPDTVQAVGDLTIVVRATDSVSGISEVHVLIDGEGRARGDATPFSWRWHSGEETTGNHRVEARVRDHEGNRGSAEITIATLAQ